MITLLLFILVISSLSENIPYTKRREMCAGWHCKEIDKNDKYGRDLCLHQCVDQHCYTRFYADLNGTVPQFNSSREMNIDRERRKKAFTKCVDSIEKYVLYPEKRNSCAKWHCKDVDKENPILRDFCLHQCMDVFCFYEIYGEVELEGVPIREITEAERIVFKEKFRNCFEKSIPRWFFPNQDKTRQPDLTDAEKKDKTYKFLREKCAKSVCTKQDYQNDVKGREYCIHKCIDTKCFEKTYLNITQIKGVEVSEEMSLEEKEIRKNIFLECFEIEKKEKRMYQARRKDCAQKLCKEIDKEDKFLRDICLHRCVSYLCFLGTYQQYLSFKSENEIKAYLNKEHLDYESSRELVKDKFMDCVDGDTPKKAKSYNAQRQEYSQECWYIDQDEKLQRDFCLHSLISPGCHALVYWDIIKYGFPEQIDIQQEDHEALTKRELFKSCIGEIKVSKAHKLEYSKKRAIVSSQYCKGIDKSQEWDRDICLNKVISPECFEFVYGNITSQEDIEFESE